MMSTKSVFFFCILFLLGFPLFSNAEAGVDYAAAVNKAGKQRMLSQRIAKAYLFLGMRSEQTRRASRCSRASTSSSKITRS